MKSGVVLKAHEDVFSAGRQILAELQNHHTDARRVSACIDWIPGLAKALRNAAQKRLGTRGQVTDTKHAVTLIGFERLDGLVKTYLQAEYVRKTGRKPNLPSAQLLEVTRPDLPLHRPKYAAL